MSKNTWEKYCDTTAPNYSRKYGWEDGPSLSGPRALAILLAAETDGLDGLSKINPAMTRKQVHEILSAVNTKKPVGYIISRNIIREFTKQAKLLSSAT